MCLYVSIFTIRIPISKALTGAYDGGYMYVFEMCRYRTLDIVIYILLLITQYVYKR